MQNKVAAAVQMKTRTTVMKDTVMMSWWCLNYELDLVYAVCSWCFMAGVCIVGM